MGFATHMILETVPAWPPDARTRIRPSTGHHATLPEPCPELTLRTEGAHEEAFVHLPTAQVSQTESMAVIQTLRPPVAAGKPRTGAGYPPRPRCANRPRPGPGARGAPGTPAAPG